MDVVKPWKSNEKSVVVRGRECRRLLSHLRFSLTELTTPAATPTGEANADLARAVTVSIAQPVWPADRYAV